MNLQETMIYQGLENPVADAQTVFRQLLTAMSEPGKMMTIDAVQEHPGALHPATYAIALTLLDQSTKLQLSPNLAEQDVLNTLRFHSAVNQNCTLSDADFVICNEDERMDLGQLNQGSETYPDQSCTLIIQCRSFSLGSYFELFGPGIEHKCRIRCSGIDDSLMAQREHQDSYFPMGIDVILICGRTFFCLPRTTQIIRECQ